MTDHQLEGDAAEVDLGEGAFLARLHRAAVDVLMRAGGALLAGYRAGGTPGRAAEGAP